MVKSEQVAVTMQEAVDGYREKTIRIASIEQVELGNIMELSNHGSCAQMGKIIEPLWRTVGEQGRWLEPGESQSHDSVTIREGEERRSAVQR